MKLSITTLLTVAALLCSSVNATLTSSEKDKLLSLHRSTRNAVGASNMKSMSWDSGLAASAEKYAAKCKKNTHDRTKQNLAWTEGKRDVAHLFGLWKEEKSAFLKSGQVTNFSGEKYDDDAVGHYTQIVWASASKVGCGLHECDGFYQLVCHYDEGNTIGSKVYEGGEKGHSEKKTEKKTTSRKTTTSKKTTTTTTTTTTIKKVTVPTVNVPKKVGNTTKVVATSNKLAFGTATKLGTAAKLGTAVNTPLATPLATPIAKNTKPSKKITGKGDESKKDKNDSSSDKGSKMISGLEENKEKGSNVTAGIAITGSVVGAAAAFVFLKKNPKQYEKLTRSISRKASSVKRGASVVTRRLTTKRNNTNTIPEHNTDAYNINYRVDFAESMQV